MSGDTLDQLKRALLTLKDLRRKLDVVEQARTEPIAIIGMGCRFPGAKSPAAFWELLKNGGDAIREIPPERWDVATLYDADATTPGKIASKWGGFLPEIDEFDPYFFGISPREAARMDPQQRLLLEVAWEALEDAGQTKEKLTGSATGVFVGVHSQSADYYLMQVDDLKALDTYSGTGTSHSVIAGRLSYLFDWHGPNITLDTACSSSLVAVNLAIQSLRNKECNLALAAGVNVILSPHFTVAASRMHMLSADGRCKPFDARADGFVRGEGCGVIVLKRLSDAIADGDVICALLRGSAINHDGNTNGLTAPSGLAQQEVIRQALANAGLRPDQISYIEAHGTGTSLGDPIEVEALSSVFSNVQNNIYLGSAKANVGHLEGAAGVAGVIKAALSLQQQAIVPLPHFTQLNPHISLKDAPFVIPTKFTSWQTDGKPRIAGVSSFGWSGTNAHVILEEAPVPASVAHEAERSVHRQWLPLSAGTHTALQAQAQLYRNYLLQTDDALPDIIYTACQRRTHHEFRLVVSGHSFAELVEQLGAYLQGENRPGMVSGRKSPNQEANLVFVFPGQGGQWLGMGRELLEREEVFRKVIERCEAAMRPYVDWSLVEQLTTDEAHSRLDEIDVVQPLLFAIQVGLATLWRAWGIEPHAVVGHSMGEVAAAHVAGVLSLEDAVQVICHRSRLMRRVSGKGAMAVVELGMQEAQARLAGYEGRLGIAVNNGPKSVVLSGDPAALEEIMHTLQEEQIFCRLIKVDVAAHSPHMDALKPELVQKLHGLQANAPAIPIYSTVVGAQVEQQAMNAEYWGQNLRQPVRFAAATQQLVEDGYNVFVEIGPHPVLIQNIQNGWPDRDLITLPSLRRHEDAEVVMTETTGGLYCAGYPLDWKRFNSSEKMVKLPIYPWQHEHFWLEVDDQGQYNRHSHTPPHPLLGWRVETAGATDKFVYENVITPSTHPTLYQSRVRDMPVVTAADLLRWVLAAARHSFGDGRYTLTEVATHQVLVLPGEQATTLQIVLLTSMQTPTFSIYSGTAGAWKLHISGKIRSGCEIEQPALDPVKPLPLHGKIARNCDDLYNQFARNGLTFEPAARFLGDVWAGDNEVLAKIRLGQHETGAEPGFQAASVLVGSDSRIYFPSYIQEVASPVSLANPAWAWARGAAAEGDRLIQDITLFDEQGNVQLEIKGARLQPLEIDALQMEEWAYEMAWRPSPIDQEAQQKLTGKWLIFADHTGIAAALAAQLQNEGSSSVLVYPGRAYHKEAESITIRPDQIDDMRRLLQEEFSERGPSCVINLWGLNVTTEDVQDVAMLDEVQTRACLPVLYLVQCMHKAEWAEIPRLWLVTQGAQPVNGEIAATSLMHSLLWGFGRVIAEEQRELWGGLIDLSPQTNAEDAVSWLWQQVHAQDGEDQIAFYNGQRYVPRLTRAEPPSEALPSLRFHADASYLITGGLGGIALQVARWMVNNGARRLILAGRTPLPPRHEWLQVDPSSRAGQRIASVRMLESLGASVHLVALDVADVRQLSSFLEQYRNEGWPPIQGVMHTAAAIEDRLLVNLDREAFLSVLKPKVLGGWLLHQLLDNLDFFVLFSSVGAVLGQSGQANYAAANAFLDALAYYRNGRGLPALSVNWGGWSELGLAATAGAQRTIHHLEQQGISSFTPEQGVAALEYLMRRRLLGLGVPQAAVMPVNWTVFRQTRLAASQSRLLLDLTARSGEASAARAVATGGLQAELLAAKAEQRRGLLEGYLQKQVARVLKLEVARVEATKPLGLLGIDSLMALELRNRLETDLGVAFSATLVWNYPTIVEMVPHIASKIGVALESDAVKEQERFLSDQSLQDVMEDLEALSDEEALKRLLGNGR